MFKAKKSVNDQQKGEEGVDGYMYHVWQLPDGGFRVSRIAEVSDGGPALGVKSMGSFKRKEDADAFAKKIKKNN